MLQYKNANKQMNKLMFRRTIVYDINARFCPTSSPLANPYHAWDAYRSRDKMADWKRTCRHFCGRPCDFRIFIAYKAWPQEVMTLSTWVSIENPLFQTSAYHIVRCISEQPYKTTSSCWSWLTYLMNSFVRLFRGFYWWSLMSYRYIHIQPVLQELHWLPDGK